MFGPDEDEEEEEDGEYDDDDGTGATDWGGQSEDAPEYR